MVVPQKDKQLHQEKESREHKSSVIREIPPLKNKFEVITDYRTEQESEKITDNAR